MNELALVRATGSRRPTLLRKARVNVWPGCQHYSGLGAHQLLL